MQLLHVQEMWKQKAWGFKIIEHHEFTLCHNTPTHLQESHTDIKRVTNVIVSFKRRKRKEELNILKNKYINRKCQAEDDL